MLRKVHTVDEVLAALPADQRATLRKLRRTIRAAAPDAEECVAYGIAAFRWHGMLVGFGAGATHCSFYLMSSTVVKDFSSELRGRKMGKGTIRFTPDHPLPAALVRRLVKARIAENIARR